MSFNMQPCYNVVADIPAHTTEIRPYSKEEEEIPKAVTHEVSSPQKVRYRRIQQKLLPSFLAAGKAALQKMQKIPEKIQKKMTDRMYKSKRTKDVV